MLINRMLVAPIVFPLRNKINSEKFSCVCNLGYETYKYI